MELLAVELTGFILLVWSLKVLLTFSKKPIAVFSFKDAKHRFKIKKPGHYSIGVLGAGFIEHDQRAIITVTSEEGHVSNARHALCYFLLLLQYDMAFIAGDFQYNMPVDTLLALPT